MEVADVSVEALRLLSEQARASLLVESQRRYGLDVKLPSVTRVYTTAVQVSCVVCDGGSCRRSTFRIPFVDGMSVRRADELRGVPLLLPHPTPDFSLAVRLLTQPLAIAAICGVTLLTYCLVSPPTAGTDALLRLVGGRASDMPVLVLLCAHAAHVVEAAIAFFEARRLVPSIGLAGAMRWSGLVLLVGYPVLRHVLALRAKS